MDEKFYQFLKRDIEEIEEKLQEYTKRSPRFHVHEQMQRSYLHFCDKAKEIFQKTAEQLLNTLDSIEELRNFDSATQKLETELVQVRTLLKGNNSNTKTEDAYKAIQQVGGLRQKVNLFAETFNPNESLKGLPTICFDERAIEKLIYVDQEIQFQNSSHPSEIVFNRFSELKMKENWTVGPGRVDAIRFKFLRPVKITGFKCFDNKNADPFGIKYNVFLNGNQVIQRQEDEYPQSGEDAHQTHVHFKKLLDVGKDDVVDIAMEYTNYGDTYCCRGQGLREGKEKGKNDFIIVEKSELDQNCTKHDIGQIPAISYVLSG